VHAVARDHIVYHTLQSEFGEFDVGGSLMIALSYFRWLDEVYREVRELIDFEGMPLIKPWMVLEWVCTAGVCLGTSTTTILRGVFLVCRPTLQGVYHRVDYQRSIQEGSERRGQR